MLTTTLDGLWVLQVLTGLEVLAPEIGLRPHLPSVENSRMALAHPVAAELRAAGVIADDGAVDATVLEWLTVLSRRDAALLVYGHIQGGAQTPARILLARFAQWWVALERRGIEVTLSGVGVATTESSANELINSQIERLCGQMSPARLRPVSLPIDLVLETVGDTGRLRSLLVNQRLDVEQIATLTLAADNDCSAQASMVAIQSGVRGEVARTHIGPGAVTIIDTMQGRLVSEHLSHCGSSWLMIGPGSRSAIGGSVQRMLRRLPAEKDWHSFRKAV